MKKSTPFWCEDCRFVCFETGLGKLMLTLNDPNGLKNTTIVYSIHLELRMASSCRISAGKLKYVNPCLDFLGIPDQRTAYVERQVRLWWTYIRRSSVTPDPAWISNHTPTKVGKKLFIHSQASTVAVWKWRSNFIPLLIMDVITYAV